jgi:hypothetical protein
MDTTNNYGNLSTELASAVFVPMDSNKNKSPANGNRYCRLIKKGENSKLAASVAVEIPNSTGLPDVSKHHAVNAYLLSAYHQLQNEAVKALAISGALTVPFSVLSLDNLESVATALNESAGIGHISEERIKAWFDADARDMMLVYISDRLGFSDNISDADLLKCNQVANQLRDNLAKLSAKKPVQFADKVKDALNGALNSLVSSGDEFAPRLVAKLNMSVCDDDMLSML